jgi:hypothetical protein
VLLATETVGDVVVWAVFSSALTGELALPVEVERLAGLAGRLALVGALWVAVPIIGSEAVTEVTVEIGNELGLAATEFKI